MSEEDTRYASMREFPEALAEIDKTYSEFSELAEIIKNCELMKKHGRILNSQNPEQTKFLLNGTKYSFKKEKEESGHRYGDGGEYGYYHFLQRGKENVLVSMRFVAYDTYSDDSEDHPTSDVRKTFLLQEDNLARTVFEEIRKLNKS